MAAIARRDAGWTVMPCAALRCCSTKSASSAFTFYWIRREHREKNSPLVEAFNPFGKLACADTPLTTDLESGQFFARDQAFYRSLRHPQQLSDLADSEQLRIKISFHRAHIG
jgi:hypothetical protein